MATDNSGPRVDAAKAMKHWPRWRGRRKPSDQRGYQRAVHGDQLRWIHIVCAGRSQHPRLVHEDGGACSDRGVRPVTHRRCASVSAPHQRTPNCGLCSSLLCIGGHSTASGQLSTVCSAGVQMQTWMPVGRSIKGVYRRDALAARAQSSANMLASSGHPDCAKIVNPIDAPPTRSPLQVHTALARRFSGLSVIEVGTRNGDGAECWASAASKLYAVEMDHKYCGILRARSSKLPRGFEVLCTKFARIPPEILLSADYFTCAQPAVSHPRPAPAA
eukprot:scaffold22395_cov61-Phaeocystis_antarctica.AAC.3